MTQQEFFREWLDNYPKSWKKFMGYLSSYTYDIDNGNTYDGYHDYDNIFHIFRNEISIHFESRKFKMSK